MVTALKRAFKARESRHGSADSSAASKLPQTVACRALNSKKSNKSLLAVKIIPLIALGTMLLWQNKSYVSSWQSYGVTWQVKSFYSGVPCLNILTLGGSVTAGSPGFSSRHPDAPEGRGIGAYPSALENLLNTNFPCTQGSHTVMNKATPGCSAKCNLEKWSENYQLFAEHEWDLVIIEPTANTKVSEMNHLQALVAAFTFLTHTSPSIILLSASFRLPQDHPKTYEELPKIEQLVSDLSALWNIPFVSFPRYLFSNNNYNSSNHERHCIEARCTFFLDGVHLTKTAHNIIARLLLQVITSNKRSLDLGNLDNIKKEDATISISPEAAIKLPSKPAISVEESLSPVVESLLPKSPVAWISFRTTNLLSPSSNEILTCLEGFTPHDSRGRLSAMYDFGIANDKNRTYDGNLGIGYNASFIFEMPRRQCKQEKDFSKFEIILEFLHSYTTNGVLDLQVRDDKDLMNITCEEHNISEWNIVGQFNSSNDQQLSVSNSMKFEVDGGASFVKGTVYGGDFHLLSVGFFCL